MPAAIAAALGVRPTDLPLLDAIVAYLRSRRLLLVVDNAGHVVDGATVVGRLLDAARGLTVLVTSRVPLRISGEQPRVGAVGAPTSTTNPKTSATTGCGYAR